MSTGAVYFDLDTPVGSHASHTEMPTPFPTFPQWIADGLMRRAALGPDCSEEEANAKVGATRLHSVTVLAVSVLAVHFLFHHATYALANSGPCRCKSEACYGGRSFQ